jgi:hypothetical protein
MASDSRFWSPPAVRTQGTLQREEPKAFVSHGVYAQLRFLGLALRLVASPGASPKATYPRLHTQG